MKPQLQRLALGFAFTFNTACEVATPTREAGVPKPTDGRSTIDIGERPVPTSDLPLLPDREPFDEPHVEADLGSGADVVGDNRGDASLAPADVLRFDAAMDVGTIDCSDISNLLDRQCETRAYASEFATLRANTDGWLDPSNTTVRGNHQVASAAELRALVQRGLLPGDVVEVSDGVWRDETVTIRANGTRERPIVVRARNRGEVRLTAGSVLDLRGAYIVVEGFAFRDGFSRPGDAGVQPTVALRIGNDGEPCTHCTVANVSFDGYSLSNPYPARLTDGSVPPSPSSIWVTMVGQWNRITQCEFINKIDVGNTIQTRGLARYPADYHLIDRNRFVGRPRCIDSARNPINGCETIALYSLQRGEDIVRPDGSVEGTRYWGDSYSYIRGNYFDQQNGEWELMTLKASKIAVMGNTFQRSGHTVTLRTSNSSVVEGNVFTSSAGEPGGGVRIIGRRHAIVHNVFQALDGRSADGTAVSDVFPVIVYDGDPGTTRYLSYPEGYQYWPVSETIVGFNLFAYNHRNLQTGGGYVAGRAIVAPENSVFAYNLLYYGTITNQSSSLTLRSMSMAFHNNTIAYANNVPDVGFARRNEPDLIEYDSMRLVYRPSPASRIVGLGAVDRRAYADAYAQIRTDVAARNDILRRLEFVTQPQGTPIAIRRLGWGDVGPVAYRVP
jgi:hypothetical protein